MTLFVHTAGDPAAMAPSIREEVKALAPDLPVFDVRTMRDVFEGFGLLASRIAAETTGTMGLIGLALTVLGLYAKIAFMVSQRIREIGIRMALGATSGEVQREVLMAGLKATAIGVAIGLVISFATSHYFAGFISVNPRDPMIFTSVPILLLVVAVAACWAPAGRASRVDPAVTLRYE
jgi:ABC-type antimicrobial peptide transport system permease subunit